MRRRLPDTEQFFSEKAETIRRLTLCGTRWNLKAPSLTLSNETLTRLDEIWSGLGEEAPEAYAW